MRIFITVLFLIFCNVSRAAPTLRDNIENYVKVAFYEIKINNPNLTDREINNRILGIPAALRAIQTTNGAADSESIKSAVYYSLIYGHNKIYIDDLAYSLAYLFQIEKISNPKINEDILNEAVCSIIDEISLRD